MRIIAGTLGGRNFNSPHGHRTHPMSDKARGALFGTIGDITGLTVLDAFSGSGALGFEALSRGAASVVAIDSDVGAHETIIKNSQSLGLEGKIKAVRAYVNAWSTRHRSQLFDIVFADPPYDDLPYRDLKVLTKHVKKDGLLVLSWPGKSDPYYLPGYKEIKINRYGDMQLIFYKELDK